MLASLAQTTVEGSLNADRCKDVHPVRPDPRQRKTVIMARDRRRSLSETILRKVFIQNSSAPGGDEFVPGKD